MSLNKGDTCPKCEKGIMEEHEHEIEKKLKKIDDHEFYVYKMGLYLVCTKCENNISLGKTRWR
jgi:hypothetical protein